MCGVAGIFLKQGTDYLGGKLLEMLRLIRHRGMDSSGVALYGPPRTGRYCCRISFREKEAFAGLETLLGDRVKVVESYCEPTNSPYTMFTAVLEADEVEIGRLYREINARTDLCVHSLDQSVLVVKDIGEAKFLRGARSLENFSARHGIGHVRLATESIDNLNFAHPFTSALYPALAIVHNGQLTNYFNLRRRLERRGVVFKTHNDSELIAHYLAYQITREGRALQEALELAIEELDGVYSCLVATENEVGAFQDRLGLKPILVCELPGMVLFGSERICFAPLQVEAGESWEIKPGEARTWSH